MQYANINDAQAAMTSDQYVGLNADGTYGLFDRAQNPQWVGACQYAYQVAGVPFPNGLYGVGMTATATVEPAGKRKLFALLLWLFLGVWGGHDFYAGKKWLGVAHVLLFFAWLWMLFFGVLIPINGYEFFAFLILLVLCAMTFVELLALLISSKYGECSRWEFYDLEGPRCVEALLLPRVSDHPPPPSWWAFS